MSVESRKYVKCSSILKNNDQNFVSISQYFILMCYQICNRISNLPNNISLKNPCANICPSVPGWVIARLVLLIKINYKTHALKQGPNKFKDPQILVKVYLTKA